MIITLLAALSSLIIFFNKKIRDHSRPPLTAVKVNDRKLLSNVERNICDTLTGAGYYVSCRVPFGLTVLPIALIPFRCAVYPRMNPFQSAIISIYLSLKGWKVFFLSEKTDRQNFDDVINNVIDVLNKEVAIYKGNEPEGKVQ